MGKDIRRPVCVAMAQVTLLRCDEMIGRFSSCLRAVVAAVTATDNGVVIKVDRCPVVGGVAGIALRTCLNVGWMFAGCGYTVVTTCATAEHCGVIDAHYRRPGQAIVAVIAGVGALDMNWVFTGGRAAIVAANTT